MSARFTYQGMVDRGLVANEAANLRWRKAVWEAGFGGRDAVEGLLGPAAEGLADEDVRRYLVGCCRRDILFWANTFVWLFEARARGAGIGERRRRDKCIPFLTYPAFQNDALLRLQSAIRDGHDILVRKSRDMGATWMCLAVFLWYWLFELDCTFLVLSAKEEMVDKPGNPKSLFAKMIYLVERLPGWMRPRYVKTTMHLENLDTRSVVDGEATSGNTSVSDRRMALLLDEFAKVDMKEHGLGGKILRVTADVTDCRIFNSTPEGEDSGFAVVAQSSTPQIALHWSRHPRKNMGLYRVGDDGEHEILDQKWHRENPGYSFRTEPGGYEGLRSPWYDGECDRRHSDKEIAQELDMSFIGSGEPYFKELRLAMLRKAHGCSPFLNGRADDFLPLVSGKKVSVDDGAYRPMRLWFHPTGRGLPPQGTTYTIGVDVAAGTGASDSVISVGDDRTGRKVMAYVSNQISPTALGSLAVSIAKWFSTPLGRAYLIWDGGGHGGPFGDMVVQREAYDNVYYHVNKSERRWKKSRVPGVPSNRKLKLSLMSQYRAAMFEERFITPSMDSYRQCEQYVYDGNGGVMHKASSVTDSSSDRGEQHGDEAMSEAILVLGMAERPAPIPLEPEIPVGSYKWRTERHDSLKEATARRWYN